MPGVDKKSVFSKPNSKPTQMGPTIEAQKKLKSTEKVDNSKTKKKSEVTINEAIKDTQKKINKSVDNFLNKGKIENEDKKNENVNNKLVPANVEKQKIVSDQLYRAMLVDVASDLKPNPQMMQMLKKTDEKKYKQMLVLQSALDDAQIQKLEQQSNLTITKGTTKAVKLATIIALSKGNAIKPFLRKWARDSFFDAVNNQAKTKSGQENSSVVSIKESGNLEKDAHDLIYKNAINNAQMYGLASEQQWQMLSDEERKKIKTMANTFQLQKESYDVNQQQIKGMKNSEKAVFATGSIVKDILQSGDIKGVTQNELKIAATNKVLKELENWANDFAEGKDVWVPEVKQLTPEQKEKVKELDEKVKKYQATPPPMAGM